jgi:hypothetical protein
LGGDARSFALCHHNRQTEGCRSIERDAFSGRRIFLGTTRPLSAFRLRPRKNGPASLRVKLDTGGLA